MVMMAAITVAVTTATDRPLRSVRPGRQCLPGRRRCRAIVDDPPVTTPTSVSAASRREHGFALLIVLWVLAFLALLGAHFAASGRAAIDLARNERSAAAVEAATAGAIQWTMFRLLQAGGAIQGDARPFGEVRIGDTQVALTVEDEGERLNPNLAEAPELTALVQAAGADPRTAASIAAAILDWRTGGTLPRPGGAKDPQYRAAERLYGPPDAPFRSIAELGLVLGMTPALLDRLLPHLTVFTDFDPTGVSGDPVVTRALLASAPAGSVPQRADLGAIAVARITATGHGPDDATVTLRAIVRLNATPDGLPFEILSWRRLDR
jgi:general secretion pathway protein K